MHLERPFYPHLPPCRHSADISAARNPNNSHTLSLCIIICTYIYVRKMFLQEHFGKIAVMFLQEHPPAPIPPTPLGRWDGRIPRPYVTCACIALGYNG
jgi:hypothetical protein